MNNLRFRAWDKANKEMLKIDVIDFFLEQIRVLENDGSCFSIKFKDVDIMKSTGFHDKNGVEIFEGDVVSRFQRTVEEVVWNSKKGWWAIQTRGEIGLTVLAQFIEAVEIIGNIYENKELLG